MEVLLQEMYCATSHIASPLFPSKLFYFVFFFFFPFGFSVIFVLWFEGLFELQFYQI